jgi:shikimate kinase
MKTNIALIGYMGTGKTTIGKALATKLGKNYIEMDAEIERIAGKTIPLIFKEDGEIRFRELEIATAKQLAQKQNAVISCGGGVVVNRINIDYFKETSEIVLLTASEEIILERIMQDGQQNRPVIDKPDPINEIRKVLTIRKPLYEASSNIQIDTTNKSVDKIINEIVTKLA